MRADSWGPLSCAKLTGHPVHYRYSKCVVEPLRILGSSGHLAAGCHRGSAAGE